MTEALFYTKTGIPYPGVSQEKLNELRTRLAEEFGISSQQTIEAASYSMAMVVRYALGLSAEGGTSLGLIADCEEGCIVAATLRHLVNGGASTEIFIVGDMGIGLNSLSPSLSHQLKPLLKMGVNVRFLVKNLPPHEFRAALEQSHNVLCALNSIADTEMRFILEALNDAPTPIHVVGAPPGLNVNTGTPLKNPLFASSTLSLGLPLVGLHAGNEFVGRHYLCDISFSQPLFNELEIACPILFSDQPVQQILTTDPNAEQAPEENPE